MRIRLLKAPFFLFFENLRKPSFSSLRHGPLAKGLALFILLLAFFLFLKEGYSFFHPRSVKPILAKQVFSENNQLKILEDSPFLQTPLFGSYHPPLENAVIKPSQLNIQVLGILFSTKEEDSQVILKIDGNEENTYTKGQTLSGGILIKKITPDSIIISHGGRLERLCLEKERLIFSPPLRALLP